MSLLHSHWPYCTSIDTNAAAILSEIGMAPADLDSVLLVARTLPIRVAGNSGPMRYETSWAKISKRVGRFVEERTTVTKKVRRIAEWDDSLIDQAIIHNSPVAFAITFADYLDPRVEGRDSVEEIMQSDVVRGFIEYFEKRHGVPVAMIGTGGHRTAVARVREDLFNG